MLYLYYNSEAICKGFGEVRFNLNMGFLPLVLWAFVLYAIYGDFVLLSSNTRQPEYVNIFGFCSNFLSFYISYVYFVLPIRRNILAFVYLLIEV